MTTPTSEISSAETVTSNLPSSPPTTNTNESDACTVPTAKVPSEASSTVKQPEHFAWPFFGKPRKTEIDTQANDVDWKDLEDDTSSSSSSSGDSDDNNSSSSGDDNSSSSLVKTGVSRSAVTAVLINFFSFGYIVLPYAFALGGTLLTTFILAVVACTTYVCSQMILESCAHAEALETCKENNRKLPDGYSMEIRDRKFEFSLLTQTFLDGKNSKFWSTFFSTVTCLDLYGYTWAYCTVFASAFAEQFPTSLMEHDYHFYVGIFIVICVPLTCTSILDQIYLQIGFLAARMVMVFLMVTTLIEAFAHNDESRFGIQTGAARGVPLADWTKINSVVQMCVFALSFQVTVPAISRLAPSRKSEDLPKIFLNATSFMYLTNLLVALLSSIYFGREGTDPSNNLNWSSYHGGTATNDSAGDGSDGALTDPANIDVMDRSRWSAAISSYIILFVALDQISTSPLDVMCLADTLMSLYYKDQVHEVEKDWNIRIRFRLAAIIPPCIAALLVRDLGVIAEIAGLFTLLSDVACPAMLYIASNKCMADNMLPRNTVYSTRWFSHDWIAYAMLVAVVCIAVGLIVDLVYRHCI